MNPLEGVSQALARKERAFLTGMNFDRLESFAGQHALTWRETIGIELALGLAAVNPYLPWCDSR